MRRRVKDRTNPARCILKAGIILKRRYIIKKGFNDRNSDEKPLLDSYMNQLLK